jgi:hypothetical protein
MKTSICIERKRVIIASQKFLLIVSNLQEMDVN